MSNTTIEPEPVSTREPDIKKPGTRLLDLLAGWGRFIDRDGAAGDSALDAYEIAGMYQNAAAEVMGLEGEAETEAVRRWVVEKILPALIRSAEVPAATDSVSVAA